MMGSFGKGASSSEQSRTETIFPGRWFGEAAPIIGRPFHLDEIVGMAPHTTSLFGGGPVGVMPYGAGPPAVGSFLPGGGGGMPGGGGAPGVGGPGGYPGGGGPPGAGGPSTGWQPRPPDFGSPDRPGTFGYEDISAMIWDAYGTRNPKDAQGLQNELTNRIVELGLDPATAKFTPAEMMNIVGESRHLADVIPAEMALRGRLTGDPRYYMQGGGLGGLDVMGGINRLGFGQAPTQYDPYQFQPTPDITAPTMEAAQFQLPGGPEKFQEALFEAEYRPVERELTRLGEREEDKLRAQLTQAGLGTSGVGFGQMRQQRTDQQERLAAAASDASHRATEQRFGFEFAQQQRQAEFEQEAALQNAGLDLQAQVAQANNILQGNIAGSENYLSTLGLNEQVAQAARQDFLGLLGIAEQDLARMDAVQQEAFASILNAWLQEAALFGQIGQVSSGTAASGGAWRVGIVG